MRLLRFLTILGLMAHILLIASFFIPRTYVIKNDIQDLREGPDTVAVEVKTVAFTGVQDTRFGHQRGTGSWYDYDFGQPGQKCRRDRYCTTQRFATCASRDYSRGNRLRVVYTQSGRSVDCLVTDYGPTRESGRIIDLSSKAFAQLAPLSVGLIEVEVEEITVK